MSNITMRPDYKPGDAEFDDDESLVRDYVISPNDPPLFWRTYAYAAQRQVAYWRHEAETKPTPDIWVGTELYDSGEFADYFVVASTAKRCIEKLAKARSGISGEIGEWKQDDDGSYSAYNTHNSFLSVIKERG